MLRNNLPVRLDQLDRSHLAAMRDRLQAFVDRGELAGIVTLVSRRGEIVANDALGWRDIEARAPMRPDTLFRIASMTKPITSVLAMMLVEQGKLTLKEPVRKWVPELADRRVLAQDAATVGETVPARRDITVEDLLTHRSGIAYGFFSEEPLKSAYEREIGDPAMTRMSVDEWLAALGRLPLAYQPGERFHYGHSTDVLGFLIGRVEGRPFAEVLRERVLGPLGMDDTEFWLPPEKRERLAGVYSYDPAQERLTRVEPAMYDTPPDYTPGGGGLISNAPDYHRFARLLLNEGTLDGIRLLRPETVRLMRTNRLTPAQREVPFAGMPIWEKSGFGLGISVVEDPVDNIYGCGRAGAMNWPGIFGTWWQADPAEDLVLIYLVQHLVPVSATTGATLATGRGAAGRQALPIFQQGVYAALPSQAVGA
ncbi:serine hydrolase domain-containing protein [Hephaestia mangrovi]|uniref:serine hydrolase domain-containing protein n=1 Tax=Hephaestia mangrovi TaxID=2873268 RepID=UPI001CA7AD87|nr:serine hydrolase domain-containing protein [Hephaestia mangrovi]MBY8829909.1 beta-lactamase family protein [Hephaestia mangrovi]